VRPAPDLLLKARLFRGLADPSRLTVLQALRDGPRCVSEIVVATGLSQPNASAHLGCLAACGLVTRERRGKFIYYAIAGRRVPKVLGEAESLLGEVGVQSFRRTRDEVKGPGARGRGRT
jgi:ArsR family transcriptional regulator, cadmium/lead-responsive transcriptional repressor